MIVDRPDLPGGKLEIVIPEKTGREPQPGEFSAYLCRMKTIAGGCVIGASWRVIQDEPKKPHKLPKMKDGKQVAGLDTDNPPEMTAYERECIMAWFRVPDMHADLSMGELVRRYGDRVLEKIPKVDRDRIDGIKIKDKPASSLPNPTWARS